MKVLTAATRGGKLAIAQTEIVISALKKIYPDIKIKIKEITTKGDRDRKTALWDLKDSGFFTTQVEDALLAGQADFAVHSLKDLPVKERRGLTIAAVCERRFCEDCLVCKSKVDSITDLPSSATIGTSSLRRAVQIKHLRKDLEVLPIRGNVTTRIKQVAEGKFDACLLARAGLERLGLAEKISICFDPAQFIPAPAQGALAVQTRCDDGDVNKLIAAIDDKATRIITYAERQILETTQCGCHAPVGAFANIAGNDIMIRAFISDLQGRNFIRREIAGKIEEAGELAKKIACEMLDAGGREILENLKK
jgi:hydroxymethylbilane synthase